MNKTYVGIDIGKAGAIAIMEHKDGGSEIHTVPMPMIKNEVDYAELSDMLRDIRVAYSCNVHIVFEKLGVIFGTGKSTAFSMGHQAGAIEMGCIAHTLSYTKVRAVDWQKQMLINNGINSNKINIVHEGIDPKKYYPIERKNNKLTFL